MTRPRLPTGLAALLCAWLAAGCGSGRLDPFEKLAPAVTPRDEDCSSVSRDETQSHVPPDLESSALTAASFDSGDFRIDWAAYPLPYLDAHEWAIWSKGLVAENGRHYSAVGDGDSAGAGTTRDGNTVLYEYDPETRELRAVGDVLTAFGAHVPGENGYGKIQGHIAEGPCGLLYMHSYWGSPRYVTYGGNYQGDLLLRYNPWTKELTSLGVKIPRLGVPTLALSRPRALIYGLASTPTDPREVVFWVYDILAESVIFQSPRRLSHDKNIALDRDGAAYYSGTSADLYRYDPTTNSEALLSATFRGGGWLRGSTRPASDGTLLFVTAEPDEIYRFDPAGQSLSLLASLTRPVSDIELDPTEQVAYLVPVGLDGLPPFELYEVNRRTGALRVLIDLGAAFAAAGGMRPSGSYSINASSDGSTLYIAANAGPNGYGSPLLIVAHLPDSVRP
jgi:hypothetical protein